MGTDPVSLLVICFDWSRVHLSFTFLLVTCFEWSRVHFSFIFTNLRVGMHLTLGIETAHWWILILPLCCRSNIQLISGVVNLGSSNWERCIKCLLVFTIIPFLSNLRDIFLLGRDWSCGSYGPHLSRLSRIFIPYFHLWVLPFKWDSRLRVLSI